MEGKDTAWGEPADGERDRDEEGPPASSSSTSTCLIVVHPQSGGFGGHPGDAEALSVDGSGADVSPEEKEGDYYSSDFESLEFSSLSTSSSGDLDAGCSAERPQPLLHQVQAHHQFSGKVVEQRKEADLSTESVNSGVHFTLKKEDLVCDYCRLTFNLKSHLLAHSPCYLVKRSIKESNRRAFDCEFCGKSFTALTKLRTHLVNHVDGTYECNFCGKGFPSKALVASHVRTHTGERPFQCKYCQKWFSQKGNLKTHQRQHTGERPFKCGSCGLTFVHRLTFKCHVERNHPGMKPSKYRQRLRSVDKATSGERSVGSKEIPQDVNPIDTNWSGFLHQIWEPEVILEESDQTYDHNVRAEKSGPLTGKAGKHNKEEGEKEFELFFISSGEEEESPESLSSRASSGCQSLG